jgi:hypothetical protein
MSQVVGANLFFQPTQISGLQLWLDGADINGNGTVPANASVISTWTDKSGNGRNATTTVAPTYDATTRNVLFNGSTQFYTLPNGTYPFGNTPYSIFIVAFTRNAANPQWVLAGGNETTNQAIGLLFFTTNAVWHSWWANEYRVDNSIVNNVPSIVNISYSSTRSIIVNGGTASVNNPGATRASPNGPNFIGRRPGDASQFFNGGMAECLVFNSEIPTSQRQQVEGYLAWKWGLQTSLPSNHPFRYIPISPQLPAPLLLPVAVQNPVFVNWQPTFISNCALWIDAADSNIVTLSGANITQLQDKSANRYTFSNANGYTYNVVKFQEIYPSFYSDSSVSSRNLGSNTSISFTQPMTFFTVCVIGGSSSSGYIFDSTATGNRMAFISYSFRALSVLIISSPRI